MAPKRPNDTRQPDDVSGRERKKQKTAAARTIAVQPTAGPSTTSENAKADPSKSVRFDSKSYSLWRTCGGVYNAYGQV